MKNKYSQEVQIKSCMYLWKGFWSMWIPSVFGFQRVFFCHGRQRRRQSIELIRSLGVGRSLKTDGVFPKPALSPTMKQKHPRPLDESWMKHNAANCNIFPWTDPDDCKPEIPSSRRVSCPTCGHYSCFQVTFEKKSFIKNLKYQEPGHAASTHVSGLSLCTPDPSPSSQSQTSSLKWYDTLRTEN